jgi:hypothetical protein
MNQEKTSGQSSRSDEAESDADSRWTDATSDDDILVVDDWDEPVLEGKDLLYNEDEPTGDLCQSLDFFKKKFGKPQRVLYPGCSGHVIDKLFPGAEIVYVDPDEAVMSALREAIGLMSTAVIMGIENYHAPDQFDLLFSLNSHGDMVQQLKDLKQGGYVFCNNYFGTQDAEKIIKLGSCELVAVVNIDCTDGKEVAVMETSNLEGYLAPIDSDNSLIGPFREKIAYYYIFLKK